MIDREMAAAIAAAPDPVAAAQSVRPALDRLAAAEAACKSIPLTLAPWIYRRRLNAAMDEWRAANLALFDAQVALLPG